MAVTDVLLVIGFVAIGLSMWFSFKQKETANDEEE
jgi:lipoprotein signal peptidase